MENKNTAGKSKQESGYMLVAVIFILTLSIMVTVGLMSATASHAKIRATVKIQADSYYKVEETLSKVSTWMQQNSKYLITPFTQANFNSNFDLGSPVNGDNEGVQFAVPTMLKMKGSNDSIMLSNNAFFGTSAFPTTTHLDTGASFNAISEFENADFGAANARVILVWARETAGNYEPIFRIDVVTGNNPDMGVHSFSYLYSTLDSNNGSAVGFYGKDGFSTQTSNNKCSSYQYTYASGAWIRGAVKSNCLIASDSAISIKSQISGNVLTNQDNGVTLVNPSGAVSGTTCASSGCHSYTPTVLSPWATTCASNQGDLTISSNTTITPSGSVPAQNCWRDITVNSNKTLTFNSTTYEYHIRKLWIKGNGNIAFPVVPDGSQIKIYVEEIVGDNLNGNMLVNTNNAPSTLKFFYTGTNALTFNGTASIHAFFDAPYADLTLNGNFNYYGGMTAKNLNMKGNASFFYDEANGGSTPVLSDMNFAIRKASQRYRLYS